MDSCEEQRIISFCTGYGGMELGLKEAGLDFRTVCYVEIEMFAQANLVAKIEQGKMDAAPIWSDIKTFPAQSFSGKVHGIIGGYPCQPFSNAGKRQGTADPRHLWPYIFEHVRTIRPVWCFFENVAGHLTLGFEEVAQSLRGLGYKVEAGLFTAAEVGAPHKRERLFILAYTEEFGTVRGPGAIQQKDGRSRGSLLRKPIGTDKELGYAKRGGLGGLPRWRPRQVVTDGHCGATGLGDPDSEQGRSQPEGRNDNAETRSAGEELANTKDSKRRRLSEKHTGRRIEEIGRSDGMWPARPGQPQYEWEEPRTVESGMGRTVNGFASRVDELRLLGNGVVPQQAAKAFVTLAGKLLC